MTSDVFWRLASPSASAPARSADSSASADAVDARLLERLAHDDVDALDATLARFWPPLVRYLVGLLHSRAAAEDIAQETFFRLWERRSSLRADGSLRGFIYQVARNLAVSEQRRTRTSERTVSAMVQEQLPFASIEIADDHLELQRAVSALPERRREILLLHSVHGLSCKEIGRLLGIAPQTVANQYSAALATLRQALPSRPMV
jgi:RNA polymerase sigma factor (sigma-70 family)